MNRAITISREYGSGGREIGEKLARRLGIPFYDKELIAMIAKEGNIETSVLASILAVDKRRKAYHEYYSTTQWGDMDAYDICLNSGLAGVEGCLEAALTYIKYVK